MVTDPFGPGVPYPPIAVECDAVTISHEHSDHNQLTGVEGPHEVLRGLAKDTKDVRAVQKTVGDVSFRSVASDHDDAGGKKRGKNAVFVMDFAGLKVVHLGDLGHELSDAARKEIGPCDVLLIPVGGFYTIDGRTAARVAEALSPRVVVPMHYKTPFISSWPISGPEDFLASQKSVRMLGKSRVDLDSSKLPAKPEVWVFEV